MSSLKICDDFTYDSLALTDVSIITKKSVHQRNMYAALQSFCVAVNSKLVLTNITLHFHFDYNNCI